MSDDDASVREMTYLLRKLDRDRLALDDGTAERLLGTGLSKDDAPPEYRRVAEALALLAAPATAAELDGEQPAVAAIAAQLAAHGVGSPRRTQTSMRRLVQISLASVAGGVTLLGGLAAANALPGAAQGVASDVLGHVGISVPDPNAHADTRGDSGSNPAPTSTPPSNHGGDVSNVARTTPATGADKGAALAVACKDLDIHPAQVVAIGDAENDVEMFRVAGTSFAMGQASDEVKRAATYVTAPNDEDGVAQAIERVLSGDL